MVPVATKNTTKGAMLVAVVMIASFTRWYFSHMIHELRQT